MKEKNDDTAKNLVLLKEKFDRIVGHISDFSFVADTILPQSNFSIYTQKVFLFVRRLIKDGEDKRFHRQENIA